MLDRLHQDHRGHVRACKHGELGAAGRGVQLDLLTDAVYEAVGAAPAAGGASAVAPARALAARVGRGRGGSC